MLPKSIKPILLASTLMMTNLPLVSVQAQGADQVELSIQIAQNMPDFTEQTQDLVSYDIIDLANIQVVYSYRNGEKSVDTLTLAPGKYRLRFYYWNDLSQNGNLVVDEFKQKIAQPTAEDQAQGKTETIQFMPGVENVLGDGSVVFDIDFDIKTGQALLDPNSQTYKDQLNIYLADPETAANNDDRPQNQLPADGGQEVTETTVAEETQTLPITFGSLLIQVSDTNGNPVGGATFDLSGTAVTSDPNGQILVNELAVGYYDLSLTQVPEGYQGTYAETIEVQGDSQTQVSIGLEEMTVAPATTGNLRIQVIDNQGQPVAGAVITLNGVEAQTDDQGYVVYSDLVAGTYQYDLVGLPESYVGAASASLEYDPTTGDANQIISVEKAVDTADILFSVKDQNGGPVVGVGILFGDRLLSTDQNGQVSVMDLSLANYTYQVTEIPQGYSGDMEAKSLDLTEKDQLLEQEIILNQAAQTSTLTIQVLDQNQEPVTGVSLSIDGESIVATDDQGQIQVSDLTLGSHTYQVTELPADYQGDQTVQSVELSADGTKVSIQLQKQIYQSVTLTFVDQFDQPVKGASVTLDGQAMTTDDQGQVVFEKIPSGDRTFQVSNLGDKFQASYEGVVSVPSDTALEQTISLERTVAPAKATIQVVNQDQDPIIGAVIQFGGLTGTTDERGQVVFSELSIGNYYYQVIEAPQGVHLTGEEIRAEIGEGQEYTGSMTLQEDKIGSAHFTLLDAAGNPIKGVTITLNQAKVTTDDQGQAIFADLEPGNYTYTLESTNYQFDASQGTLTVEKGKEKAVQVKAKVIETTTETTTLSSKSQSTTVTNDPATTSETTQATSQQPTTTETSQEPTTSQATSQTPQVTSVNTANMKQFIDPTSNVEVWVHQEDAGKVARITVNRQQDGLPQSLDNKEIDAYTVQVVDANGQPISLSHPVQVKLPTRLYNGQIQLVRNQNGALTNIANTLVNQRINFTTQTMGQFILVYGDKVAASEETTQTTQTVSVQVVTETSRQERLVNTGEGSGLWLQILAGIAGLIGIGFVLVQRKKSKL